MHAHFSYASAMGQLLSSAPILPSTDFERTAAFFKKLGFRTAAHHPNTYLILRRDGAELHFRPAADHERDPTTSHFSAYVRVLNTLGLKVDWQMQNLPESGLSSISRFVQRPWGMTEAYAIDPDGSLIKFGAPTDDSP